jgi:tetratricopeptide (TPR) repeat protein
MKQPRWKLLVAGAMLALWILPAGCRKQEAPRGGEPANLDALAEIENFKDILKKDPNNLQAQIGIGNRYFDTQQDLKAIEHYRKALELDPRNVDVRTDMAICYRRKGDADRAIEELKKVISIDPHHPQSRYNLGVILIYDKKDLEGGVRAWEELLANVPNYQYKDSLQAEITRMRATLDSMRPKTK